MEKRALLSCPVCSFLLSTRISISLFWLDGSKMISPSFGGHSFCPRRLKFDMEVKCECEGLHLCSCLSATRGLFSTGGCMCAILRLFMCCVMYAAIGGLQFKACLYAADFALTLLRHYKVVWYLISYVSQSFSILKFVCFLHLLILNFYRF